MCTENNLNLCEICWAFLCWKWLKWKRRKASFPGNTSVSRSYINVTALLTAVRSGSAPVASWLAGCVAFWSPVNRYRKVQDVLSHSRRFLPHPSPRLFKAPLDISVRSLKLRKNAEVVLERETSWCGKKKRQEAQTHGGKWDKASSRLLFPSICCCLSKHLEIFTVWKTHVTD